MGLDERVLIVDDSSVVRALLRSALEGAGYWVDEAQDVETARALLDARGYDLVITDLVMPRRGGFELVKPARSAGAVVIVLTAALSADLHARALELGAEACLAKHPGVAREVVSAARRVLEAPIPQAGGRHSGLAWPLVAA